MEPVGRYNKIEQVGEGTYGTVYKAVDRGNGAIVALKRIPLDNEEEGVPCTALREICLLKELRHPNIIPLLDVLHDDRALTLVFEYADYDLQKFMDSHKGNLEPTMIRSLMQQFLTGLAYCHAKSILHRDLKPQNLLISRGNELQLADFGLARSFAIPSNRYTADVVTLWYRSPDVLLGSTTYGAPLDMWSVGCIFAELCTGYPIFAGKTDTDQMLRIFRLLGTPTPDIWPTANTDAYPNVSLLKRPELQTQHRPVDLATVPQFQKLGPQGLDLLQAMLHYEPDKRISAAQALTHPYFNAESA